MNFQEANEKAVSLAESGALADAEALLRKVVAQDPSHAQSRHNLGAVLSQRGAVEQSVIEFRAALESTPHYLSARLNLGLALAAQGAAVEAVLAFQSVLDLAPEHVDALYNLGFTLTQLGRHGEACAYLRQAIRLQPEFADAHNGLGLALMGDGLLDDAAASFEQALRIDPRYAAAHTNLATCRKEQGRLEEAIAGFDLAIRLDPGSASTHWNRALVLLQAGDYLRGWPEYEWRWRRPASPMPAFDRPQWEGGDLAGRTVLLHAEQGLGDTIQFVRYAAEIKQRGAGRVVLRCQSPLVHLLRGAIGVDQVVAEGEPLPPFDAHLPLLSAPAACGTALATVPRPGQYVLVPTEQRQRRAATFVGPGLRIGIAWQGNPHHQLDRHRSLPLEAFRPLADIPGVRLYSLQRGPGTEQLDRWAAPLDVRTIWPDDVDADGVDPFVDTAACIQNLDLVIAPDTAVAHLAGALDVPTWVLLSAMPDYRWLLRRSDSPWYASARLFRQRHLGDWAGVMDDVAAALRTVAERRGAAAYVPAAADLPAGKRFTVLLGCYGDFPHYSIRALDSIVGGERYADHCDVFVAMNACGPATREHVRRLSDAGSIDLALELAQNRNKDPAMRAMLELVRTPYVVWVDDDAYFQSADWPRAFGDFLHRRHPMDVAGCVVAWGPHRATNPTYRAYLQARPWWRGDRHYPERVQEWIPFPLGRIFAARTAFLRQNDFPDPGMIKGLDDVALAELVLQTGGKQAAFDSSLLERIVLNDGQRRGTNGTLAEGWREDGRG